MRMCLYGKHKVYTENRWSDYYKVLYTQTNKFEIIVAMTTRLFRKYVTTKLLRMEKKEFGIHCW